MDEHGWEEQRRSGAHPLVLVLGGLVVVIAVAVLVRSSAPTAEQALEGRLPTTQVSPSSPPRPTAAPSPPPPAAGGTGGETPQPTVFDPSGRWEAVSRPPFAGPLRGPGVWDGRRVVLWNGSGTGGVYAPEVDAWAALPPAPISRSAGWSAIWTGAEVLYWGGTDEAGDPVADGVALGTNRLSWRRISPAPLAGRSDHAVAWGGGRMWVWGGTGAQGPLADGASYDPVTDRWEVLPPAPLAARTAATATWTGDSLLVWGGHAIGPPAPGEPAMTLVDGARYRPGEGWTAMADAPAAYRGAPATVWVPGSACGDAPGCDSLLVWGTPAADLHLRDGYAYHLGSDRWTELPNLLSQTRYGASGIWTGEAAAVWGGTPWRGGPPSRNGFLYDPATQRWVQIPDLPVDPGAQPTVVLTGEELLVLGDGVGGRYPVGDALADR